MHEYLIKPHILKGEMSWSRSSIKVKARVDITVELHVVAIDSLYISMHVHLMKVHILTDDMSRSMSPFTVRCSTRYTCNLSVGVNMQAAIFALVSLVTVELWPLAFAKNGKIIL